MPGPNVIGFMRIHVYRSTPDGPSSVPTVSPSIGRSLKATKEIAANTNLYEWHLACWGLNVAPKKGEDQIDVEFKRGNALIAHICALLESQNARIITRNGAGKNAERTETFQTWLQRRMGKYRHIADSETAIKDVLPKLITNWGQIHQAKLTARRKGATSIHDTFAAHSVTWTATLPSTSTFPKQTFSLLMAYQPIVLDESKPTGYFKAKGFFANEPTQNKEGTVEATAEVIMPAKTLVTEADEAFALKQIYACNGPAAAVELSTEEELRKFLDVKVENKRNAYVYLKQRAEKNKKVLSGFGNDANGEKTRNAILMAGNSIEWSAVLLYFNVRAGAAKKGSIGKRQSDAIKSSLNAYSRFPYVTFTSKGASIPTGNAVTWNYGSAYDSPEDPTLGYARIENSPEGATDEIPLWMFLGIFIQRVLNLDVGISAPLTNGEHTQKITGKTILDVIEGMEAETNILDDIANAYAKTVDSSAEDNIRIVEPPP